MATIQTPSWEKASPIQQSRNHCTRPFLLVPQDDSQLQRLYSSDPSSDRPERPRLKVQRLRERARKSDRAQPEG
ncbi:hypothetical protein NliqN6_2038 [Naganishia liquefaciens]|uniref:Uncharacterized protein n=1 Tax=Naganishia liquefaciens TaxID=104408 RepID=A0A8H3TQN5_9TREE|nr:hypothetical protein NliqN6_2038 [Naganishia liquefaciens]